MTPLSPVRVPDATSLLARAFDADPYFRFLLPDADERFRFLLGMMSSSLALGAPRGFAGAVLEGRELRGVSLWFPPGAYPSPALDTARVYMGAVGSEVLRRRVGVRTIARALWMARLLDEAQLVEPHFYLQVLAVDPRWHGRGTGSAMLRERIAEADRARLPVLLETSNGANVRLYQRFGFVVTRATCADSSPPVWTMVRARTG